MYATTVATASQMFSLIQPKEEMLETAATARKNTQIMLVLAAAIIIVLAGTIVIFRGERGPRFYRNE